MATVAMVVAALAAWTASDAHGAYGDGFGIASVNGGGSQVAPAFPGTRAYWAGACDRSALPAASDLPADLVPLGGVGTLPSTVPAPERELPNAQIQVPAPLVPEHCIDAGGVPDTQTADIWKSPPAWRAAAATQAGSHPDGSLTMWVTKGATLLPDGSLDNIRVDLPPGFVGDPNAVPKCTAVQFSARPLLCPPETQVGVLRLQLVGVPGIGCLYCTTPLSEEIVPVFNLEPRRGNVAELGVGYLASNANPEGVGFVTARIVAKARTNGDFGVTSFAGQIPAALPFVAQTITLWGVPADPANDVWRAPLGISDVGGRAGVPPHPCTFQPGGSAPDSLPWSGLTGPDCPQGYRPEWGEIRPFVSVETDCNQQPMTRLSIDSFQRQGAFTSEDDPDIPAYPAVPDPDAGWPASNWKTYGSQSPAVTDCETLDFEPDIEFGVDSRRADDPTGLSVDLAIPQKVRPPFSRPDLDAPQSHVDAYVDDAVAYWKSSAGRATAHLKDTVVEMPRGVTLNPSTATGMVSCPDAIVGLRAAGPPARFGNGDPADGRGGDDCPDGSRIGTARVQTHLLDDPLTGDVILGEPQTTDPRGVGDQRMFRLFLVLRNPERGLVAKVYGTAVADGVPGSGGSGRITATFEQNPELPFEDLKLSFKGGQRGILATPQRCGAEPDEYQSVSSFTPWSRSHLPAGEGDGTLDPVEIRQNWTVDGDCGYGFDPALKAGMSNAGAREGGTFGFEFTRPQGDQTLRGLTAELPTGLLATVKGLPLCQDAQAAAGNCPAASRIGLVDASAGSGDPFVLEQKGEIFLTEGYKGGPYGLMVKVRAIAGPFRGAMELDPIIVRQKIEVDPTTAQVKAVSDPFPTIWHGVPLRVRRVLVDVDRPEFMVNPSDCSAKQVKAQLMSVEGASADRANHFQASACAALPFKPNLTLALSGRKQITTGKHPGIRAQVTQQGVGEAGIEKAEVRLPKSLALDVNNAQALCEFVDGTKPDLEKHCPKGSIVGRARATSPLLNDPLAGNVYFVKNIRKDPKTGNEIRTLPMIIVALRGEIAVNLKGESDTTKSGKLVSTFASVPDAPVSKFDLNINGGKNGILAVTRTRRAKINLCARPNSHVAESDMDGHNGRRHDTDIRMKTPCTKKQVKAAKRQAKRAAAKQAGKR